LDSLWLIKSSCKKRTILTGLAYLSVLPVLVIFCPLGPTNFKKSRPYYILAKDAWKIPTIVFILVPLEFVFSHVPCKLYFWITRTGNTDKYASPVVRQNCLFCTGNRKCNWYAGTITVNSELDSASNAYWNCTGPEFTKFWNLNGIGDGNDKNLTRHVFKYKHTKWSCWCIIASLNYKNTMFKIVCFAPEIGNATGMPERSRSTRN
jgi:uncharacterized membrane protein YciS (DUF1049 family)